MRLEFEPNVSTVPFADNQVADGNAAEFTEVLAEGIKAAQAGDRARARTLLLSATELDAKSESAWLWLASISEYPEELIVFLNNVLEINPANERALEWSGSTKSLLSKTLVQRGIDASKEGNNAMAVECFDQALAYDEQNQMAWLWIASLSDSEERKMEYLERVLSINPNNEAAQTAMETTRAQKFETLMKNAKQTAVSGDAEGANALVDRILADFPGSEEAWMLRSLIAVNFADKVTAFEKLLEINPDNSTARAGLESLTAIMGAVEPMVEERSPQQELFTENAFEEPVVQEEGLDGGSHASHTAPFDEVAEDHKVSEMPAFDDEEPGLTAVEFEADNGPTDELEFPQSMVENNPFDAPVSNDLSSEVGEEVVFIAADDNERPVEAPAAESWDDSPAEVHTESPEDAFANIVEESEADPFDAETVQFSTDEAFGSMDGAENNYVHISEFFAGHEDQVDPVGSGIPMPDEDLFHAEAAKEDPFKTRLVVTEPVEAVSKPQAAMSYCLYCDAENDASAVVCKTCKAVLSLSDLEMLLASQPVDEAAIRKSVEKMEATRRNREFSEVELVNLAVGHLNLKNLREGFSCLQAASQLSPNDVVLGGQVNALAIRLEEIRRKEEIPDTRPKGRTILVVDDSPTVRKLISGKLEKAGHEVVTANDGVEATAMISNLVPDLVLLDINMPNMDGYQVCKIIRNNAATKEVPVVMISGKDGFFDKVRGRMAGTTGYITKPFGPETLMRTLELYLKHDETAGA